MHLTSMQMAQIGAAIYVVFMAAVTSLEPPPPTAKYFWRWAYRFVNTLAVSRPQHLGPPPVENPWAPPNPTPAAPSGQPPA